MFRAAVRLLKPDGVLFFGIPPTEWLRRWLSISFIALRRVPARDWRGWAADNRLTQALARLDTFGYPDGHINYFSRKAIKLLCRENKAYIAEQFHPQGARLMIYPLFRLTTGYYFIKKERQRA